MSAESNKALSRRLLEEAFNAGNIDVIDEIVTTDFVNHDAALPEPMIGPGAAKASINGYRTAFHAGLDAIPDDVGASERIRLALRAHLRVVAEQLDLATVFIREWRYLEGERREQIVAERRRYEERLRGLFRDGREHGELRTDLDESAAALLVLSAANWAYTWLTPGRDTDAVADSFALILVDGIRGYSTPS